MPLSLTLKKLTLSGKLPLVLIIISITVNTEHLSQVMPCAKCFACILPSDILYILPRFVTFPRPLEGWGFFKNLFCSMLQLQQLQQC